MTKHQMHSSEIDFVKDYLMQFINKIMSSIGIYAIIRLNL